MLIFLKRGLKVQSIDLAGVGMTSQRTRERLIQRLADQGITNQSVLETIRITPRHIFLDEALSHRAYEDTALPIGFSQTISQPFVVAKMTQLVLQGAHDSVLEIGTGSGYQTAILAKLCASVHSLERISAFIPKARERLRALKLSNFSLHLADGYKGLEESGPFDAIICTAAPKSIPSELMNQLKIGGRMIIPVGDSVQQQLKVIERKEEEFQSNVEDYVMFVPLQEGCTQGASAKSDAHTCCSSHSLACVPSIKTQTNPNPLATDSRCHPPNERR